MIKTIKLHHEHPFLTECEATVIAIDPEKGIVLDQTVSYPEMGGQLGDTGVLVINDIAEINYTDTQKGVGRVLFLPDFPTIPVETPTYHKVDEEDLSKFYIGQKVKVKLNSERRGQLTISHSGIHLVLMGLEKIYPGIYKSIKGCSIKEAGARLDFGVDYKFTADDVARVQDYVGNVIALAKEMFVFPHQIEKEAWYWQLDDYIIPCGGTHLRKTSNIGNVTLKKENLGKSAQRMSFVFNNYKIPYDDYQISKQHS